jgi:hypothetical protein
MAAAGLDGAAAPGGGAPILGFRAASGTATGAPRAGPGPETPGLDVPVGAAGAVAPTAGLEPVAAPGATGAAAAGGVAPGAGLALGLAAGLAAPGGDTAALGGAGGAPLAPGTGSALGFGKDWFGRSAFGAFAG